MALELESADVAPSPLRPRTDAEVLLGALRALAAARDLSAVMAVVRRAARDLVRADGVTFVLREGPLVHYADEDAIAPLWKGRRFPAEACISGWAMLHRESVAIEDIYADARVPHEAYRPTFVRSLAMVPIRREDPLGAIGAYWAHPHLASARQLAHLESLAAAAGLAVANVDLAARLHAAVRLRDEFIALAAHELSTPFAALRLRAEAVVRGRPSAEGRPDVERRGGRMRLPRSEGGLGGARGPLAGGGGDRVSPRQVDRLRATVDRLGDVIAALGDFSRASRDGISLARAPVELVAVTRAAVERVRVRDRTDATSTPLRVEAGGPIVGDWDAERLGQAVAHLVENAAKFGRGRPVSVTVSEERGDARVAVHDEGPGVAEEDHARIFGRFERASSPLSHGGLGLGLWMARAIAEAHGGAIAVESSRGEGATFTLVLPRRLPAGG